MRIVLAATLALAIAGMPVGPARADNPMGYRLLSAQEAAALPRNHGALGMDVERAERISDAGLTFDLIRVKQVRRGSAGEHAGFRAGDEIIALDGQVFPSLEAFAAYVGSLPPGRQVSIDYIPSGGGPGQAQRVPVTIGGGDGKTGGGLSTGAKVAIGVGAAALLGCYELGCFSHRTPAPRQGQPAP